LGPPSAGDIPASQQHEQRRYPNNTCNFTITAIQSQPYPLQSHNFTLHRNLIHHVGHFKLAAENAQK
jgi:hypothetical protein